MANAPDRPVLLTGASGNLGRSLARGLGAVRRGAKAPPQFFFLCR